MRKRFNVTRVVTYGSPVGRTRVPSNVRSLNVEQRYDPVPRLDGSATGSGNRTHVVLNQPNADLNGTKRDPIQAHDMDQYARDYHTLSRSGSVPAAVQDFERNVKPFYEGHARTYVFEAAREPKPHPAKPAQLPKPPKVWSTDPKLRYGTPSYSFDR